MEAWLTEMLDHVISYEAERYKTTRPAAFMNWPTLDPIFMSQRRRIVKRLSSGERRVNQ